MIIEFCGPPGAGKSTLAHALAIELRRDGHHVSLPLEAMSPRQPRVHRVARKILTAAQEAVMHPLASWRVVEVVVRSNQLSQRDVVVRAGNWLMLRGALRRSRRLPGISILDQGVVQELCSLGYLGRPSANVNIADPGAAGLGPDLIVVVNIDLALAAERLGARPGRESRIERSGLDLRSELVRQAALVASLRNEWLDRFGPRIPTQVRFVANNLDGPRPSVAELASACVTSAPLGPSASSTSSNGHHVRPLMRRASGLRPSVSRAHRRKVAAPRSVVAR